MILTNKFLTVVINNFYNLRVGVQWMRNARVCLKEEEDELKGWSE